MEGRKEGKSRSPKPEQSEPPVSALNLQMINWANLPVDALNGVTAPELRLLTHLSLADHRDDDDLSRFIAYLEDPGQNDDDILGVILPEVGPDGVPKVGAEKEIDEAEVQSLPKTTREQMTQYGQQFVDFMASVGHATERLRSMESSEINEYLRLFYFRLCKANGELYSPATLVCIRAGIQRYFRHILQRNLDLVGAPEFAKSNRMLRVKVRDWNNAGGAVKHFEPIEEADLAKLHKYFDRTTGEKLQDEVLFTLLYILGERGQEHLKALRRRQLLIAKEDADGNAYMELPPLSTKNQSADPVRAKGYVPKQARIYGKQLELLQLYGATLPAETKDDTFFPRPMPNKDGQVVYSAKQTRGINWLGSLMQRLSQVCTLSKRYTNHCIRVTRIADLRDAGFTINDIMSITGQQSEATVRRYLSRKRDRTMRDLATSVSDALVRHVEGESEPAPRVVSSATSNVSNRAVSVTGRNYAAVFGDCSFTNCTFTIGPPQEPH